MIFLIILIILILLIILKDKAKPNETDEVLIHVTGTIKNENKIFYNTRKLEKPLRTKLNSPELPEALKIALQTMKLNEIAILTCKPDYCYKDGRL